MKISTIAMRAYAVKMQIPTSTHSIRIDRKSPKPKVWRKQIVDECCYYTKIKHNYLSISGITKSIAAPVVMRVGDLLTTNIGQGSCQVKTHRTHLHTVWTLVTPLSRDIHQTRRWHPLQKYHCPSGTLSWLLLDGTHPLECCRSTAR